MPEPGTLHRVVIEGAADGPHLLITGGVHGDEFEPMAAVRTLARLVEPGVLAGRLTLVPVVNEPAFGRGDRCGDDGRDLARSCPGSANGSPTERVAFALSGLIRAADYYIDLHTGGTRYRVLPLAGYMLHSAAAVLERQRRMARAFNLPIVWGTSASLEGRSLSVARDANVPAIYTEYLGGGVFDPEAVAAGVEGCLNVMCALRMLDRPRPASRIELQVEDDRPTSGHLQIQNPAPFEGFFEPAVGLGARVRAGDALGSVTDLVGARVETIRAREEGLVLVLRTFPSVRQGDSVGVILALDGRTD